MLPLHLFYEEPDSDRWLPFDRHPRRVIRRVVRGPGQPGGMMRYFLNLRDGLKRIGEPFTVNDYRSARKNPDALLGIIGKPHVLRKMRGPNPLLFGPAVFSHPIDEPLLFEWSRVQKVLVSCEWMKQMWSAAYPPERMEVWAAGLDTYLWHPSMAEKNIDVLVYDKIRWNYPELTETMLKPMVRSLSDRQLKVETIRYGFYKEEDFRNMLARSKAMVFLCEHETQGFAYLQALACGVPILAWDDGGFWRDPTYYPHRVRFEPISAVPYWDARCGVKFRGPEEFEARLDEFLGKLDRRGFAPRDYILENLTLEECARRYVAHYRQVEAEAKA